MLVSFLAGQFREVRNTSLFELLEVVYSYVPSVGIVCVNAHGVTSWGRDVVHHGYEHYVRTL